MYRMGSRVYIGMKNSGKRRILIHGGNSDNMDMHFSINIHMYTGQLGFFPMIQSSSKPTTGFLQWFNHVINHFINSQNQPTNQPTNQISNP